MKLYLVLFVLFLDFGDLTFLHHEKVPIFYCLKVCPLYCSKREKRDVDYSPIYWDEDEELPFPPFIEEHVPSHGHSLKHWKKTTTEKTTVKTTTKKPLHFKLPHFIDDYDSAFNSEPYYYIKHWKITEKPTRTTATEIPDIKQLYPVYINVHDVTFEVPPFYNQNHWETTTKKPTTTTKATTTEKTTFICAVCIKKCGNMLHST